MKQTEDFVLVIKNQKWLMLYQKSANTKIVINNRISTQMKLSEDFVTVIKNLI
jgi:hypothetical protein